MDIRNAFSTLEIPTLSRLEQEMTDIDINRITRIRIIFFIIKSSGLLIDDDYFITI